MKINTRIGRWEIQQTLIENNNDFANINQLESLKVSIASQ